MDDFLEAAQEKARAREQDQRKADARRDQYPAQPSRMRRRRRRGGAQGALQIDARRRQCGRDAEERGARRGHREGEPQHIAVEVDRPGSR